MCQVVHTSLEQILKLCDKIISNNVDAFEASMSKPGTLKFYIDPPHTPFCGGKIANAAPTKVARCLELIPSSSFGSAKKKSLIFIHMWVSFWYAPHCHTSTILYRTVLQS